MTDTGDDALRTFLRQRGVAPKVVEGGLEYLVAGWERTAAEAEQGYELEIEDWLNDLDGRQLLFEARAHVGDGEWGSLADRLAAADAKFRAATVEVEECLWGEPEALVRGYTREVNWWYWRRWRQPS